MTKEYTTRDLNKIIEETYPNDYVAQAGALRATLSSVLISVKSRDPNLFEEIMEFEFRVSERFKEREQKEAKDA